MRRWVLGALLLSSLTSALGCSSEWVSPEATSRSPRSVAVLPFVAQSKIADDPLARSYAQLLTRIVSGRLAPGPYLLLPHAEVQARLARAGLVGPEDAQGASSEVLREALEVDMVVRGVLEEDAHLQAGLVFWRSLGYRVEAVDLRDGAHLLTLEHLEVNLGGVLLNASQVLDGVQRTLASHSDLAFVRLAELLAEELVTCLPAPLVKPEVTPPQIYEVEVSVERAPLPSHTALGAESRLAVTLRGEPGMRATLRFGGGRALPLAEVTSGVYRLVYRVAPGDQSAAPRVVLSDPYGAARVWPVDLKLDLRAPAPPEGLALRREGQELVLSWSAPRGSVPRGRYVVYGESAEARLEELARTGETELRLSSEQERSRYYVAALSASGVLGAPRAVEAP